MFLEEIIKEPPDDDRLSSYIRVRVTGGGGYPDERRELVTSLNEKETSEDQRSILVIEGAPKFEVGERLLLFLKSTRTSHKHSSIQEEERDDDGGVHTDEVYQICEFSLGAFHVKTTTNNDGGNDEKGPDVEDDGGERSNKAFFGLRSDAPIPFIHTGGNSRSVQAPMANRNSLIAIRPIDLPSSNALEIPPSDSNNKQPLKHYKRARTSMEEMMKVRDFDKFRSWLLDRSRSQARPQDYIVHIPSRYPTIETLNRRYSESMDQRESDRKPSRR